MSQVMNKKDLTALLDKLGVKYPEDASNKDLEKLLQSFNPTPVSMDAKASAYFNNSEDKESDHSGEQEAKAEELQKLPDGFVQGDPKLFVKGAKPKWFNKVYGVDARETFEQFGAADEINNILDKYFLREHGFQFLFNSLDNYKFTIQVPLDFTNRAREELSVEPFDCRSRKLEAGAFESGIENFCKLVTANLGYQKAAYRQ